MICITLSIWKCWCFFNYFPLCNFGKVYWLLKVVVVLCVPAIWVFSCLPAHDSTCTVSHGLFSLSLYSTVILGFILVGTTVLCCLLCPFSCCFEGIVLLFPESLVSSSSLWSSSLLLVSSWNDESVCGLILVWQWINFVFWGLGTLMVDVSVSGVGWGGGVMNWSWQGWTLK